MATSTLETLPAAPIRARAKRGSQAMPTPFSLKAATAATLTIWVLIAAFPLFWILVMSFKLPVDAFSSDPLDVVVGPSTREAGEGLSLIDMVGGLAVLVLGYNLIASRASSLARRFDFGGSGAVGWVVASLLVAVGGLVVVGVVMPAALTLLEGVASRIPGLGWLAEPLIGATGRHYWAVWVRNGFYRNFQNSLLITAGVVTVSLTVGTLAGYALARRKSSLAFWLLITALIFPGRF